MLRWAWVMRLEQAITAGRDSRSRGSLRAVALSALALGLLALCPGQASADTPIEGVWSFNGGQVAIQGQEDGTFVGTVVAPTKFSQCYHPVGEEMWTQVRLQPDGSYQGFHQWYFATSECVPNPALGLTAWRVLRAPDGSKLLRVCFSAPGSSSQPTIAVDGSNRGVTFGCSDSARISALPSIKRSEVGKYLSLPSNRHCVGRAKMRIRIHDPVSDPFEKISVMLRSGPVHRRAKLKRHVHDVVATLRLRGLPRQNFTVTVRTRTLLGSSLSTKRTYRVCSAPATVRARTGRHGH
jgi:hypothetical protein